jgi:hypothetical protein
MTIPRTTIDLRAEAAAEVRRVSGARSMIRDGDEQALTRLEADGTWVARSRRGPLKRSLGRRICLVWRVAFEDAAGRVVESRLVPMLVEVGPDFLASPQPLRARLRSLLHQIEGPARARIDADCRSWRTHVTHLAGAFTAARLTRERIIADRLPAGSDAVAQAGLFDRRAERDRQDHRAALAECERALRDRLQAAAAGGAIALVAPRLLLVLVS